MGARAVLLSVSAFAGLLAACGGAATSDPGADAFFRIPGAQFYRGPMPSAAPGAPAVTSVVLANSYIHASYVGVPVSGALAPGAVAAAIGLEGDLGYWVVPAGLPNVATPQSPSYAATGTFSAGIVPGSYTLLVRAVDGHGRFGAPSSQILQAQAAPATPKGVLVFTLTWDTEADLDLHVVDPNGVEIHHGSMSDQPPPFAPQPDGGSYGYLDGDSNANCVIDGKRQEDVLWPDRPPPGTYVVRVDAASLCSQPVARWRVRAVLDGKTLGEASGVALDPSTWPPHGAGAGVAALTLDVR